MKHRGAIRASGCQHPICVDCDVRRIAVCASVGPDLLPRLSAMAMPCSVAEGHLLFDEGDPAENVFVVVGGMLKLYKLMVDGRRQIVGFMVPGDFLGLAFGRLYVYSAEAVTEVSVCRFSRGRFLALLDECPSLEKEIMSRTATELAAAQEQMLLLGRKNALERVASFLVCMTRRYRLPPGQPLALPMNRVDIADYLGLSTETVSRTLTTLRRMRLIDTDGKHLVEVCRQDQLEQMAEL